jgi:hypothetical protein
MNHGFNVDVAIKFGVDGAIIIENLYFWINKNKANNRHFYEGHFWTYNSIKAFTELFPYWSYKQLRRILSNLIKDGAIKDGNYNKKGYDKTKWYRLTSEVYELYHSGTSIGPNGHMDMTKQANGLDQMGEPIPDINTDIKPDIKQESSFSPEEFMDEMLKAGKHLGAINEALHAVGNKKDIKNKRAYALKVIEIQNGNYNEAEEQIKHEARKKEPIDFSKLKSKLKSIGTNMAI